jgi:hypothetical protein
MDVETENLDEKIEIDINRIDLHGLEPKLSETPLANNMVMRIKKHQRGRSRNFHPTDIENYTSNHQ